MAGGKRREEATAIVAEWKLARVRPRPSVVMRPRLFALLDRHADASLTLVTAPVGFGKTELLASWVDSHPDLSAAWVSLDPADGDPRRFWTYVAHAVDRVRSGMARPALARLRIPGASLNEAIDELVNGIGTFDGRLVIVIDDLHVVPRDSATHASLVYAAEHLPAPARIVAATRFDPVVKLGRLRASGTVVDVRADELAFTVAESKELLVDRIGVELALDDLELLVRRTEGWAAGISLAGLWLGEVDDPAERVRSFTGDQRQVADYLSDEVLDALDPAVRSFLVRTSILDRLSGRLCDAVVGDEGSASRLEELARSNLFVVPLDPRGEWYRCHQLFRDLLALELVHEDDSFVRELHRRAAAWFVENDMFEEALEHTAVTGDPAAVARLLGEQYLALIRSSRVDLFLNWLERLPNEVMLESPVLAAAGVMGYVVSGQAVDESAARWLALATSAAETQPAPVQLRVAIVTELFRAGVIVDDLASAVRSARHAVELAVGRDEELVAGSYSILAYALYLDGDDDGAELAARTAAELPEVNQRPHALISALACLALVDSERWHLTTARAFADRALDAARSLGLGGGAAAGLARVAIGQVLLSAGNAAEAERHLERAELLRRAARPSLEHVHALLLLVQARIGRGRLQLAATELDQAFGALDSFSDAGRLTDLAERVKASLSDALGSATTPAERLTSSELAVLRLLVTDLSQREIGRELYLSHNTVKTHSRSVYRKLGANTRDEAVRRAASIGLLRS